MTPEEDRGISQNHERVTNDENQCHVGFIMGKAKLAPYPAHRIPCLELCAAVLAVEMVDVEMHAVRFFN